MSDSVTPESALDLIRKFAPSRKTVTEGEVKVVQSAHDALEKALAMVEDPTRKGVQVVFDTADVEVNERLNYSSSDWVIVAFLRSRLPHGSANAAEHVAFERTRASLHKFETEICVNLDLVRTAL